MSIGIETKRLVLRDFIETPSDPKGNFADCSEVEEMGEFFNRRADGYESHMTEIGFDSEAYRRAGAPLPQTDKEVKFSTWAVAPGWN
jgi:hypothetical protein